jgi:2-isopropylmalate synthase
VHFYNSTSTTQRRVVFRTDRAGIIDIAVQGAKLCKELRDADANPERIRFEYSPESYTGTEPDFAVEVCEAVMDIIEPTPTTRSSSTCRRRSRCRPPTSTPT